MIDMPTTTTEYRSEVIAEGLRKLGLKKGDAVLFHSDLRALGPARDLVKYKDKNMGADLIIEGFLQAVGQEGLVIGPALSATFAPGEPGPVKLAFNPATTPSRVGSITEVFRKWPGNHRSAHPTHSLSAVGSRAAEFIAGHDKGSTFDRKTCYGRCYDWNGYICFFGTDMRTCTSIHAVEDWMDLPYMEEAYALVEQPDGSAKKVKVYKSPCGPRDFYRRNSKIDQYHQAKGFIKTAEIYNATVSLMKARDLCDSTWQAITENPTILLNDSPDADPWSKWACEATRKHIEMNIKGKRLKP
jgi:aminoglycoside 3-N-acetyltransferase